jgi:hypothetical protein
MTFLELYGTELDRELGNSSNQLFTVARRKAAINAAQLEFVKRTECLQRQTTITIVDGTQEYDLDAIANADFGWIAAQGPSIAITSGTTVRYLEGDALIETTVGRLNVEQPGWRAVSAGTPTQYYVRPDGGSLYLGFHPKPDIVGTETWAVLLPYVAVPADMSLDADQPFTISSNPIKALRFYHRALVHYAAYDLEKLRKEVARSAGQLQLFELQIQQYIAGQKPKQGSVVRMAMDYRAVGRNAKPVRFDPRT